MKTLDPQSMATRDIFTRLLGPELVDRLVAEGYRILVINPGSTSTKIAYFEGIERKAGFEAHVSPDVEDSAEQRAGMILNWMAREDIELPGLHGIAARGGVFKPVRGGTYPICPALLEDLSNTWLQHASNLGVVIAEALKDLASITSARDIPVTVTDPVVIDEVDIECRMTGLKDFKTDGTAAHYLNHRAVLRVSAWEFGIDPNEASVISAHLGGGISLIRHHQGRAVRVMNAFSGVPSANRSGMLPIHDVIHALRDQRMDFNALAKGVFSEGGLLSLTGTDDFRTLLGFRDHGATSEQVEKINLVLRFMAQRVSEGVLSMAAGWGRPDYICLTGGLSASDELADMIEERIGGLLPIVRVPGSLEQESLAAGMAHALLEPSILRDYVSERDRLREFRGREDRLIDQSVFRKPVLRRREGSPMRNLDELIQATRSMVHEFFRPTIAIAGSDNEDALEAGRRATEEGDYNIARFLLVGNVERTRVMADELNLELREDDFELIEAADPVARSIELYAEGRCQVLMKGSVQTADILGGIFGWLKAEDLIARDALFSHVAVFQRTEQGKLLLLSDCGINIDPDRTKKKRILENALMVARSLNLPQPKVAVISAIEKVNPRIASSVDAAAIAEDYREREDCVVEGPLSYDVAVDPDIAAEKGYRGEIQGNADILILPGIDSGNTMYKSLSVSSGMHVAGAFVGCGVPVVLTSRGDSALSKLASLALCLRLFFSRYRERMAAADADNATEDKQPLD